MNDPILLSCCGCDYEWTYKGLSEWYATCPRCRNKVRVKKQEEK